MLLGINHTLRPFSKGVYNRYRVPLQCIKAAQPLEVLNSLHRVLQGYYKAGIGSL